jgi:acetyl-CoA decarbonylase/synthase complex subunit gamma
VKVEGRVATLAGNVSRVSTRWRLGDWLGRVLARLGFRRMSYAIAPGLYAVGQPGPDSPVLVSANYKLSFDVLRRAIAGLDAWILVLDSNGVNVWCAAGKGTFGTAELARRVESTPLAQVVRHRRLVVPQLGAPSVAAHEVERLTDFGVVFGPVRADDIPEFLAAGYKATPGMRRVTFGIVDRLEVSGLELATAGRATALLSLLVLATTAWNGTALSWASAWSASVPVLLALWGGVLAGTVLFAAMLPWLPGRMFAVKGAFLGSVVAAGAWIGGEGLLPEEAPVALPLALALVTVAVTSYLGANYTGSTTFTSLSGVKKELRVAIPVMAVALVAATVLPVAALVLTELTR